MTPDAYKASYRDLLARVGEPIVLRRYTGAGTNRPKADWSVQGRVMDFSPDELIGGIVQGDRRVILLAQDLIDGQFPLPIQTGPNHKAVIRGRELQIKAVDDATLRFKGEIVAYKLVVGG